MLANIDFTDLFNKTRPPPLEWIDWFISLRSTHVLHQYMKTSKTTDFRVAKAQELAIIQRCQMSIGY